MVFAAGGLLWREGDADANGGTGVGAPRLLAVVHRPRYDDWALPKGKVEPGELLPETAVREVEEETGYRVRREGFAGRYQYAVDGVPKSVFVWQMRLAEDASDDGGDDTGSDSGDGEGDDTGSDSGDDSEDAIGRESTGGDDEVDRLLWLTPTAALSRLSYENERALLERVTAAAPTDG